MVNFVITISSQFLRNLKKYFGYTLNRAIKLNFKKP